MATEETAHLESRIEELERENATLTARVQEIIDSQSRLVADHRAGDIHYQVAEFHGAFGYPVRSVPEVPEYSEIDLRVRLVTEEFCEFLFAIFNSYGGGCWVDDIRETLQKLAAHQRQAVNMGDLADALADLDYVIEGTRLTFGIPGKAIAKEVHRSNMAKRGGEYVEGKLQKPPGWTPPDIRRVLVEHGWVP